MTPNVSSPNTPPRIEAPVLILCSASSPAKTSKPSSLGFNLPVSYAWSIGMAQRVSRHDICPSGLLCLGRKKLRQAVRGRRARLRQRLVRLFGRHVAIQNEQP